MYVFTFKILLFFHFNRLGALGWTSATEDSFAEACKGRPMTMDFQATVLPASLPLVSGAAITGSGPEGPLDSTSLDQ